MTWFKAFLERHQVLVPFIILALATGVAFWMTESDDQERKYQICYADLEDRVLLEDILNFVSNNSQSAASIDTSNLPPELADLIEESKANSIAFNEFANERVNIPPKICKGTGLTEDDIRADQVDREQGG